jgi:hypothetical protein
MTVSRTFLRPAALYSGLQIACSSSGWSDQEGPARQFLLVGFGLSILFADQQERLGITPCDRDFSLCHHLL